MNKQYTPTVQTKQKIPSKPILYFRLQYILQDTMHNVCLSQHFDNSVHVSWSHWSGNFGDQALFFFSAGFSLLALFLVI